MDDLYAELRLLKDLGFTELDLTRGSATVAETKSTDAPVAIADAGAAARFLEGLPEAADILALSSMAELDQVARNCVRCRLAKGRTQVVVGSGNRNAELMFVGEAPGRDEDLEGYPFVGRAGKLLTDIIGAMQLRRDDVYIANVIKCRPPENRNPEPDELAACRPWIDRQIELIAPRVIVTLGKFAAQSLLGRGVAISAVRGEWHSYGAIRVMPTYHPAYLLRTPSAKKDVWKDMQKVMGELGIAVPEK
ncbi:MAG TPA: uracil-DNA glycosylase [Thermoanaerobaculia bacterium]|nr:uracil-DNA glycosylase [Thermoanaerobaculia bacterium]